MSEKKAKLNRKNQPIPIDYTAERDERCIPVVYELLKLIVEMTPTQLKACFDPNLQREASKEISKKMLVHMLKANLLATDVDYVYDIANTAISAVKKDISDTLDENTTRISETLYGLPIHGLHELSLKNINDASMRIEKLKEVWKPIMLDESLGKEIE
jgi:hypothetical protein